MLDSYVLVSGAAAGSASSREIACSAGSVSRSAWSRSQAADVVFGYTITNDITSPGLKDRDSMALELPITVDPAPEWRAVHPVDAHVLYLTYHARSKGCDTFAPMGPWLDTADSVPNPNDLAVRGFLDDEEVLTDSTAHLSHSCPR